MGEGHGVLILLLCLLQIKHMFADYFMQTKMMLDGRDQYAHVGRVLHAGIHAAGSLLVFVVVGAPLSFVIPLVVAEWIVHFHIDWWKGRHTSAHNLTPADAAYWRATGIDQALHQLTYAGMIWLWLVFAAT